MSIVFLRKVLRSGRFGEAGKIIGISPDATHAVRRRLHSLPLVLSPAFRRQYSDE